jgi:hypothetical protein
VKLAWDKIQTGFPHIKFRKNPRDVDFDLHVNVPATLEGGMVRLPPYLTGRELCDR